MNINTAMNVTLNGQTIALHPSMAPTEIEMALTTLRLRAGTAQEQALAATGTTARPIPRT